MVKKNGKHNAKTDVTHQAGKGAAVKVPVYSISKKKVELLYGIVNEEIMKVRIKLCNLSDKELSNQVNELLAGLCYEAPQKAIDIFLKTK